MKIVSVETFMVPPRWLFCRVATDEGIAGWGEPVIEGRAETVRAAVDQLAELLLGRDPLRVEDSWQLLSRSGFYRGGPILSSAVAGLDQALWDIAGKAYDVPVHALLGGHVRDRVRVYSWVGGDDPGELREAIQTQVESGFTAIKMNACGRMPLGPSVRDLNAVIERAMVAREILGPGRHLAIDFHGRIRAATARQLLPLLEAARPLFVEEPVLPEHAHVLRELTRSTSVPIATGERLYCRSDFLPALEAGIAVAQPDLSHAGGISEVRRIAALSEVWDVSLAPHCPLGPIALAASLQVAFATPNFLIQEQSDGIHYHESGGLLDYLVDKEVLRFVDGHIDRLVGPGLGIDVDEAAVRRVDEIGHRWRAPVWRHADGSLAEW